MNTNLEIMIVDDHPILLVLLKQLLAQFGYNVTVFDNVLEACEKVKAQNFDIIFCDIQMPVHDGVDMMFMLDKANYQGNVVLISSVELTVLSAIRAMCENFSFDVLGIIEKPYTLKSIEDVLAMRSKLGTQTFPTRNNIEVSDEEFLIALAKGQIQNYYQPQVDFETATVTAYEALARWVHPEYGVLFPDTFLPIVERCQLSAELFDTVLNNALDDMKANGLCKKIAINVNQFNLDDSNFAQTFIARCLERGVTPSSFIIEITEHDTYKNSVSLYKNLTKLRVNDVAVSIDDFGTGNSSLVKLAQLPFNEMKIDRSFIFDLTKDQKKKNIVLSICGLAKNLGIKLVAEGVEDQETWSLLKEYGVDLCQGYFVSKPLPFKLVSNINIDIR
ncbi:EAL domain-containing response regulator [Vibrio sp. TMPB1044]|uniref:EAL domain-containing response regulator n=1 Tax=Vibrio sp. TMPB1044 TaxID=3051822 RepID=UPI00255BA457|nr:EAL domain-containing response regulator [Vibrio sp. TMPB1044]MDL5027205.1 EAL domain-containing response regulator [Vibrio sp. TMPB1044]MDN5207333.1 EAL domain-containing response regulator [Vibrio sp. TMPB1044]